MTPLQTELLTIAIIEHHGTSLTAADKREISRKVNDSARHRDRFIQKMHSPTYKWKKPAPAR